jgi:hypothetical protein
MSLTHRKLRALLFASLLIPLSLAMSAPARMMKSPGEKSKTQSKTEKGKDARPPLVRLNVTVPDAVNRPVNDVNQDDFQVFENDAPQTITSLAPLRELSFSSLRLKLSHYPLKPAPRLRPSAC